MNSKNYVWVFKDPFKEYNTQDIEIGKKIVWLVV